MFKSLPPEILLHIISYCIDITNSMQLKNHIEFITTFQSLSKTINSHVDMIKYFTDFWLNIASRCLLSGHQQEHDEKVLKLIGNLKRDHRRMILLARHISYLQCRERMNHGKDLELYFMVLGAGGVGKSSIVVRYVLDQFVEEYDPTIEDVYRKKVQFAGSVIALDILDTAGQEEHCPNYMRERYLRCSDCFIIVLSINGNYSIGEARELSETIVRIRDRLDLPIIFAINKVDLINNHIDEIDDSTLLLFTNEIKTMVKDLKLTNTSIIECSAKSSHNINMVFEECIRKKYCVDMGMVDIVQNVIKYDSKYLKKMNKQKDNCRIN